MATKKEKILKNGIAKKGEKNEEKLQKRVKIIKKTVMKMSRNQTKKWGKIDMKMVKKLKKSQIMAKNWKISQKLIKIKSREKIMVKRLRKWRKND